MPFWNVVDIKLPKMYLMAISTTQYTIASDVANAWRKRFPNREFGVVKTSELEPHKLKEVGE